MSTDALARSQSVRTGAADAFRSLLVHIPSDTEALPRLNAAAALARRLDATLIGVGAECMDTAIVNEVTGVSTVLIAELHEKIAAGLDAAERAFRAATGDLATEWMACEARPDHVMTGLARSADLIIAGGAPLRNDNPMRWCDPAHLILHSGRPVLVVPPEGGELRGECVLVGWKDTREARRAVSDAIPFLCDAQEVVVQEICARDAVEDAERHTAAVVDRLKRHDIPARAEVVIAPPGQIAAELDATAKSIGADLVVAGGYGHSRLGEWLFGGVTRHFLKHPACFRLFSH